MSRCLRRPARTRICTRRRSFPTWALPPFVARAFDHRHHCGMRCFLLALIILGATAARADWQYTRWGMKLDELVSLPPASSRRAIRRTSPAEQRDFAIDGVGDPL